MSPHRRTLIAPTYLTLASLIILSSITNLVWLVQDDRPLPAGDDYAYLSSALAFFDRHGFWGVTDPSALRGLGLLGRPPLYQLLSMPFLALFGRSEDAAVAVNLLFLALLILSTYGIAQVAKNSKAGLLAAAVVASYPPVIHLSRRYLPHLAVAAFAGLSLWLMMLLLRDRSVKVAWLFGISIGLGLLCHPSALWIVPVPAAVCAVYLVFFDVSPKCPSNLKQTPSWLMRKLRDRFVSLGLVPGALTAFGLACSWYLTQGRKLLEFYQLRMRPDLQEYRGFATWAEGFMGVEPGFWWYAETALHTISYFFSALLIVGLVVAIAMRRATTSFLVVTLVISYYVLSQQTSLSWRFFVAVLPVAAALTGIAVVQIPARLVRGGLTVVCVAVAVFNVSLLTWGVRPWSRPIAAALGAPLASGTCVRRDPYALCSTPPRVEPETWPMRPIVQAILDDPNCQGGRYCALMLLRGGGMWLGKFRYYLQRDWPRARLLLSNPGVSNEGGPYRFEALLKSDYLLYQNISDPSSYGDLHEAATVRFLQTPPPSFAKAHEAVTTVGFPDGSEGKLVKRIRPLSMEEAQESIAALDLPETHKAGTEALLREIHEWR